MTWADLNFTLESLWWGGLVVLVIGAKLAVMWADRPRNGPGRVPTIAEREAEALRLHRSKGLPEWKPREHA